MANLIAHTVRQGERWDTLAYHYYGNAFDYGQIIQANPHIALCEVLPTGATVYIPVQTVKPTNNDNLPPWLQGANT